MVINTMLMWALVISQPKAETTQQESASKVEFGIYSKEELAARDVASQLDKEKGEALFQRGRSLLQQDGKLGEAVEVLQKASKLGSQKAQVQLVFISYRQGVATGDEKQKRTAISQLEFMSSVDAGADFLLGIAYEKFEKDLKKAESHFIKSAENGSVDAIDYLVKAYMQGWFGEVDKERSFHWLIVKAEAGEDDAIANVAHAYLNGFATKKNDDKAFYWLEKGLGKGLPLSTARLASLYMSGEGGRKNRSRGLDLFENDQNRKHGVVNIYYGAYIAGHEKALTGDEVAPPFGGGVDKAWPE